MTKFYFSHVQMVLKITSSAIQTKSYQGCISPKAGIYESQRNQDYSQLGLNTPQKSNRMCIHNHFWPTFKEKVFKTGSQTTAASAVILNLSQKSAVTA